MSSSPYFYDRVMETSVTTGTGTYTLAGAVTGFRSFSVVGNTNSCHYCAEEVDGNGAPSGGWEVGLGTYTLSGSTLSRDTILASSNSGSAVSWSSGTRRIMLVSDAALQGVGSVLLATQTASSSSSLDFVSRNAGSGTGAIFQSDFDVYEIVVNSMIPASTAQLFIRFSTNGGSTYDAGSNYSYGINFGFGTNGGGSGGGTTATGIIFRDTTTVLKANGSYAATFRVYNPLSASIYKLCAGQVAIFDNTVDILLLNVAATYRSTSAVNAFRVIPSTGAITSGSVSVYGLRK